MTADEQDVAEALRWFRETPAGVDDVLFGSAGAATRKYAATIVRAALAAGPPAGLPQVLATVEDVATVCRAAGLDTNGDDGWGVLGQPSVRVIDDPDGDIDEIEVDPPGSDDTIATIYRGAPSSLLTAAIAAARTAGTTS